MKEHFYSYLDGFNRVTVIYPKEYLTNINLKKFFVLIEENAIELSIKETHDLGREIKYICMLPESLSLNIEYTIIDEKNRRSNLRIGSIVRTDLFEMLYSYNKNDLGVTYTKEATTFKVWSPTAKEMEIELIGPDGKHNYYDLISMPRGIWSLTIAKDLEGYKYRYHVRINSDFQTTLDPYGISSDANAKYNYVINPEKLYQFKYPKPEFWQK
jgi:pullulanase